MARLSTEPKRNRLFFEFWNEGMWNRAVRVRMQRELDRYREAFRPMAEAVIAADPEPVRRQYRRRSRRRRRELHQGVRRPIDGRT